MSSDPGMPTNADARPARRPVRYPPMVLACAGGLIAGGLNGLLLLAEWPGLGTGQARYFNVEIVFAGFAHGFILALGIVLALDWTRNAPIGLMPAAFVLGSIAGWLGVFPFQLGGSIPGKQGSFRENLEILFSREALQIAGMYFGGPVAMLMTLCLRRIRSIAALIVAPLCGALGASAFGSNFFVRDPGGMRTGLMPAALVYGALFGFLLAMGWIWGEVHGLGMPRDRRSILHRGRSARKATAAEERPKP